MPHKMHGAWGFQVDLLKLMVLLPNRDILNYAFLTVNLRILYMGVLRMFLNTMLCLYKDIHVNSLYHILASAYCSWWQLESP